MSGAAPWGAVAGGDGREAAVEEGAGVAAAPVVAADADKVTVRGRVRGRVGPVEIARVTPNAGAARPTPALRMGRVARLPTGVPSAMRATDERDWARSSVGVHGVAGEGCGGPRGATGSTGTPSCTHEGLDGSWGAGTPTPAAGVLGAGGTGGAAGRTPSIGSSSRRSSSMGRTSASAAAPSPPGAAVAFAVAEGAVMSVVEAGSRVASGALSPPLPVGWWAEAPS